MLISVGWLPPFIDSSWKLPRSNVAGRFMIADLTGSRILPIVAAVASLDRSLTAPSGAKRCRTGSGDGPDEAAQFSGHGHTHLVDLYPASVEPCKSRRQPQLRLPGHIPDGLRQGFLAPLSAIADACFEPVIPRRLGKQAPGMGVAGLGDTAPAKPIATGVLRGHQAQITHQLARVSKSTDVTNFGHQSDSTDHIDATQRLQRHHHWLKAPTLDRAGQRICHTRDPLIGTLYRLPVLGECRLGANLVEIKRAQPTIVGLAPGTLAAVANATTQQKPFQLVTCLRARINRVLARTSQIPDRLVHRLGNPYRLELPGTCQLGQAQAVTPVSLDPIPSPLGNQRGGDHLTVIAPVREFPLQSISCGTRLIRDVHRFAQTHQHLEQPGDIMRDRAQYAPRRAPRFSRRHHDCALVNVQTYKNLDTLIHGPSPFALLMTLSQYVARHGLPCNLRRRRRAIRIPRCGHDV